MSDSGSVTIRTRKFLRNPLLSRSQFVIDVHHPTLACVSKDEIRERLAKSYKVEKDQISVFHFKYAYGGGKSVGFGLLYDSVDSLKKFEPRYRLIRYGLAEKPERDSKKQRAEKKNRGKKIFGTGRHQAKRQAQRQG